MLSQLEFKLNVEKQYLKGIEKMVQLYQMEGDRKSKADAAGRHFESKQKIQILKQSLKRYEDLHIDMESTADAPDGKISCPLLDYVPSLPLNRRQHQYPEHAETSHWTALHSDTFS